MFEELKAWLGERAENYTDAQLTLALKLAMVEVQSICKREIDLELEVAVLGIAEIKLNRMHTEGLSSQSFSGASESFIDGYPQEIKDILISKRKLKTL